MDARDAFLSTCVELHDAARKYRTKHDGMFDVVQAREYPLLDKVALHTQAVPKYKDCASKVYQCIRRYCRANDIDLAVSVKFAVQLHFHGAPDVEDEFWVPSLMHGYALWATRASAVTSGLRATLSINSNRRMF